MEFKGEMDEIPDERIRPAKLEDTREKTTHGEDLKKTLEEDLEMSIGENDSKKSQEIEINPILPGLLPMQEPNEKEILKMKELKMEEERSISEESEESGSSEEESEEIEEREKKGILGEDGEEEANEEKVIIEMKEAKMQKGEPPVPEQMMIPMQQYPMQPPQMQQYPMQQYPMQQYPMQQYPMQPQMQQPQMQQYRMQQAQSKMQQLRIQAEQLQSAEKQEIGMVAYQMEGVPAPPLTQSHPTYYLARPYDKTHHLSDIHPPPISTIHRFKTIQPKKTICCPKGDRWALNLILIILVFVLFPFSFVMGDTVFIAFVVFYVVYWIECRKAKILNFLGTMTKDSETLEKIEELKKGGPFTVWEIQCYHKERKLKTNSDYSTKVTYVRVNTHHASRNIVHKNWTDITPKLEGLDRVKISRIYFRVLLAYTNPSYEIDYQKRRAEFIKENNRDTKYDFVESQCIKGLKPYILSFHGGNTFFKSITKRKYYLYCLCFLGWYIRYDLCKNSDRIDYDFIKVIQP